MYRHRVVAKASPRHTKQSYRQHTSEYCHSQERWWDHQRYPCRHPCNHCRLAVECLSHQKFCLVLILSLSHWVRVIQNSSVESPDPWSHHLFIYGYHHYMWRGVRWKGGEIRGDGSGCGGRAIRTLKNEYSWIARGTSRADVLIPLSYSITFSIFGQSEKMYMWSEVPGLNARSLSLFSIFVLPFQCGNLNWMRSKVRFRWVWVIFVGTGGLVWSYCCWCCCCSSTTNNAIDSWHPIQILLRDHVCVSSLHCWRSHETLIA